MDNDWRGRKEGVGGAEKESAEHRMSFIMTDKWEKIRLAGRTTMPVKLCKVSRQQNEI